MSNNAISNKSIFTSAASGTTVIGWDVGGAHLKAVALSAGGEIQQILQLPCPLWRGLDQVETAIQVALTTLNIKSNHIQHAVTMTGELVDLFPNRHTGVIEIATKLTNLLSCDGSDVQFYAANNGFVSLAASSALTASIASANWHASASALAMHVQDALCVDIGSTTTDIIVIQSGKVYTQSISDAQRMQADGLVYTGVVRTPVMALANKLTFEGAETNVAAEYFATMADVYRLTGELAQGADMAETADGKGKSVLESARRLARMIGHDVEDKPIEIWQDFAVTCRSVQMAQIKAAVLKHLKPHVPIIGAGAGSFLVKALANDLGHAYLPVSSVLEKHFTLEKHFKSNQALEVCFPAYAVASLFLSLNQTQYQTQLLTQPNQQRHA
jgi:(4-(4-[2-(gamma-L-glutamylamino)ethyl]phenoxymethyl)furan-2-yl)methanamine synthase